MPESVEQSGPLPVGRLVVGAALLIVIPLVPAMLNRSDDRVRPAEGVVVVTGSAPGASSSPTPPTTPASQAPPAPPPATIAAHIRQAYPLLSDVTFSCACEACTLTAKVLPLSDQRDLDKRQEMLLGGLAAMLAKDGYNLELPFQFEETDYNLFHLTAKATRRAT